MDTKSARSKSAGTRSGVNPLKLDAQILVEGGMSFRDVAKQVGAGYSTIRQWAKAGGWERGREQEQISKRQEAQRLVEQGMSFVEAAKRVAVHYTTILNWARAEGWEVQANPKKQQAQELAEGRMNLADVAKQVGVSYSTIRRWANEEGWEGSAALKLKAKSLVGQGFNFSETARNIGVTQPTVSKWATDECWERGEDLLKLKQLSKRQQAQSLVEDGLNFTETARRAGVDKATIRRWAKDGNWQRPKP